MPYDMEVTKPVKPYVFWGLEVTDKKDDQYVATCPFCLKEEHFFVNSKNGLWDCKVCGEQGNLNVFLENVYNLLKDKEQDALLRSFAESKNVPLSGLHDWQVVQNGTKIVVPYYNANGRITDLRYRTLHSKFQSTEGCSLGLFGVKQLINNDKPVYLCEGETDTISLHWLLKRTGEPGIVIGVPGAHNFKKEFIPYFAGQEVITCFDCDKTGNAGRDKLLKLLETTTKSLKILDWPEATKVGYDVKDLIYDKALKNSTPKNGLVFFKSLLRHYSEQKNKDEVNYLSIKERPTLDEIKSDLGKVIDLSPELETAFELILACVMSVQLPGTDQIWMFLVGPPGGGKSTLLSLLKDDPHCMFQSSLRGPSLVSGFQLNGKKDPSILANVNEKTLIVKDFTEVLAKSENEKEQIFSIMRDAYDGYVDRVFGNNVQRKYIVKFSFIAGVTSAIKGFSTQIFGERYLRFSLGSTINPELQQEMALNKILYGETLLVDIKLKIRKFLDYQYDANPDACAAKIPDWFKDKVKALARIVGTCRTQVSRFVFGGLRDEIIYRPEIESGNRLVIQFTKVALALAFVRNTDIDEEIYSIVRKIAFDTCDSFHFDLIVALIAIDKPVSGKTLSEALNLPTTSISRYLDDLNHLKIVQITKEGRSRLYTVSKELQLLWSRI